MVVLIIKNLIRYFFLKIKKNEFNFLNYGRSWDEILERIFCSYDYGDLVFFFLGVEIFCNNNVVFFLLFIVGRVLFYMFYVYFFNFFFSNFVKVGG